MLPETGDILRRDFVIRKRPSKTYRLKNGRVLGYIDGLEAIRQAVYCILNTERFEHVIYSWNYGQELRELYGKPMGVMESKIKKRIREALTQDDRIRSVGAFSFSRNGNGLLVSFTVSSDLGEFEAEKEVDIRV